MGSKFIALLTGVVVLVVIVLDVTWHGHFQPETRAKAVTHNLESEEGLTSLVHQAGDKRFEKGADVRVSDRTAILTGSVDTEAERAKATEAALRTPGFLTVYNDIRVDSIAEPVLAQLKHLMEANRAKVKGDFNYRIGPEPHTVTLEGWVPADAPELKQALEDLAWKVPGVRNVINNIGLGHDELISEINKILQMGNIYFDYNKDTIRTESNGSVQKIAELLNRPKYADVRLMIEGHTDSTASRSYNQGLSERRAAAVKAALVASGVDAARLETVGYGEDRPIAPNSFPEGRANNRRIEFRIIHPESGTITPEANQLQQPAASAPSAPTNP